MPKIVDRSSNRSEDGDAHSSGEGPSRISVDADSGNHKAGGKARYDPNN